MRLFIVLLSMLTLSNSFSQNKELKPISDEDLSDYSSEALPPWLADNDIVTENIQSTDDLIALLDFVESLKDNTIAGINQQLNIAVDNQRFLADLADPNQKLHVIGQILKEAFTRLGVSFTLNFEDVQTRGNMHMVLLDPNGEEITRTETVDYIGRLSIENIRIGNGPSIGNIYLTNIDFAPGNIVRIRVRD